MTQYPEIHLTKLLGSDGREFVTTADFCYEHPLAGRRVVPTGFRTDFATTD